MNTFFRLRFSNLVSGLLAAGVLLAAMAVAASITRAADQPNIVFIITDDQGYGDLACHGNPVVQTPHIDQLHGRSVRLTDYHVAPTCSPTRSALLTGHWTNRTGVWHTIMGRSLLREDETTMGTIFSDAGYVTGMFGKWHLGDNYPFRPEDRGFQEVMRHGGGGVGQTPDYWDNAYFDGAYFHNGKPTPVDGFCTDVFFDYATRFIDQQKDGDKPFLTYIATNAPHGPLHCPEKYSALYKDEPESLANFLGMITNIDENVGKLWDHLEKNGLLENTIFIFTTDNGTAGGQKVFNAGMRGTKGSEYDGGHRVPFFIHWPKGNLTGGRDVDTITAHVDIVPTLMDLCEIPTPQEIRFDGRSIRTLLEGSAGDWPDRILVTDSQRVKDPIKWRKSAVMTDQWRLINGEELYDIDADPGQKTDVAKANPDVVKRLAAFYEGWWAELSPTFSQTCEIVLGNPAENPSHLTSHDWITTGASPWNHSHIRKGEDAPENTGFWAVKVETPGDYEIELRRWPVEADTAITAGLPPGDDVPGAKAYRTTPGKAFPAVKAELKIGDQQHEAPVGDGDKGVRFKVTLEKGSDELLAKFVDANGNEMGAFYAYVKKL